MWDRISLDSTGTKWIIGEYYKSLHVNKFENGQIYWKINYQSSLWKKNLNGPIAIK